jgi:DNA modification methylase
MNYKIYNEDCIAGMGRVESESVHLCVTSIPFGQLFMYSGKTEDIGNNQDGVNMEEGQFGLHMRFFCEALFRIMKPGCNVCIHIQQLLAYKNQHGWMGRRDFRNAVIFLFTSAGFNWTGEIAIPKNPQAMAQRLSLHSLMFITGKRNSRDWAPAVNDFIMIFKKPGEAEPCRALFSPAEDRIPNPEGWINSEQWIKWAEGVWGDIVETDVLDGYRSARETEEERHVCPLQLSVIYRLVSMYSAPGELVADPFMGIFSTAYVALGGKCHEGRLALPRRVIGWELKESYFALGHRTLEKLARDQSAAKDAELPLAV